MPNLDEGHCRSMRIPALNVVHICGVVAHDPRLLAGDERISAAAFDVTARTYRAGRKTKTVALSVHCFGELADAVRSRLRAGAVVLVTGSLQNQRGAAVLHVTASAVQFLTSQDE